MNQVSTNTPTASDAPARLSRAQMNIIFVTILLGMLLSALDQTIVSTALPTIVGDLGGAGHMSWVVTAYMLAETISTVLAGKFGDLFGRKRIFQLSVLIFIVGSFFCGFAQNMTTLVLFRAVQGIGGGGLMVTAVALIGEVIPLRDRGKYQGALGAVFGVTTVAGPLLGGLFTDHLSWRWAFYVNVPIAIVVIALAARTMPGSQRGGQRPKIDYLGVLFVSLAAGGLILATSWGGTEYAWGSATILGLFAGALLCLVLFIWVENRAAEPILPMRLFRGRVFTTASILSFIVGFAMMGSITFLPTFLQFVSGASATASGLRMLPMVLGLLFFAIVSGNLVGRTGKYRMYPIAGAAVTAVGLYLLSLLDQTTPIWRESLYFLILGAGIGLIMQILVLIVQNTADYRDLGTATSGVTFFRTLGGSFGAAVFGSVFANNLADLLPAALVQSGVSSDAASNPAALYALPQETRAPVVAAYAESLHSVFLWAVPVALVALVIALVLPQVTLRGAGRASDTGEGFAIPEGSDAETQLENLIGEVLRRKGRSAAPEVLAASGSSLNLATSWGLTAVDVRQAITGPTRLSSIEEGVGVPFGVLYPFFDEIVDAGFLIRDGDELWLTDAGHAQVELIAAAWRRWLQDELRGWLPETFGDRTPEHEEIDAALNRVAIRLAQESELEPSPAPGRPAAPHRRPPRPLTRPRSG